MFLMAYDYLMYLFIQYVLSTCAVCELMLPRFVQCTGCTAIPNERNKNFAFLESILLE